MLAATDTRTHFFGQNKPLAAVAELHLGDRFTYSPAPWSHHSVEVASKTSLADGRWGIVLTHVGIDAQPYRLTVPSGFTVALDSRLAENL